MSTWVGLNFAPVKLWERIDNEGENWMHTYPFWWKKGSKRPLNPLRKTEKHVKNSGRGQPESVFKLVGPKQVGKGSVRAMPCLLQLHKAGFAIWPFDRPKLPIAVEIYPQSLMKNQVTKMDRGIRKSYIEKHYGYLADKWKQSAIPTDDAFDAAVSALVMWKHIDDLAKLHGDIDQVQKLEGIIWHPDWDKHYNA